MRSGAAAAICEAIEELGPEWKARLEGPRADEDEYRSIPGAPTEWADITAQVWVTLTREAIQADEEASACLSGFGRARSRHPAPDRDTRPRKRRGPSREQSAGDEHDRGPDFFHTWRSDT
jgi:hypothetical protein